MQGLIAQGLSALHGSREELESDLSALPRTPDVPVVVLVSPSREFEERVQGVLSDETRVRRFWRDGIDAEPAARTAAEIRDGDPLVVILGPEVEPTVMLELARTFDLDCPGMSVVFVGEPSTELLRSALQVGVRDLLDPASTDTDLGVALQQLIASSSHRRTTVTAESALPDDSPRFITVVCPKGGAGKTTIATNLAVGLAAAVDEDVVIVDLDLQFGDVASALGLVAGHSFVDLARLPMPLDAPTVKAHLTEHPKGFYALCGPSKPSEADEISADRVEEVLRILAANFKYIVVDTPAGLSEATLSALDMTTDVVVISSTDVPSVRSTRKEVEALRQIMSPSQRWHFALNRANARTGLLISSIETAIGLEVDVAIPSSRSVPLSLNQGMPVIEADPRDAVSQAMQQLIQRLAPSKEPVVAASPLVRLRGNGKVKANGRIKANGKLKVKR